MADGTEDYKADDDEIEEYEPPETDDDEDEAWVSSLDPSRIGEALAANPMGCVSRTMPHAPRQPS